MGLFKKKPDPIQEKAQELQQKIHRIEREIQRLSRHPTDPQPAAANDRPSAGPGALPRFGERPPRIRSTARPEGARPHAVTEPIIEASTECADPIFEEVKNPFRSPAVHGRPRDQSMGLRQDDLVSSWERIRNHFRSPVTSNPKLVNYLAAGSIQGLRPLRYEKRVARNRFIALAGILVLILWGILALLIKR